jgi:hypothetical protein
MKVIDESFREQIANAICCALRPLPNVFAGWEGGSVAFGAVDGYSDIDLCFLVDDDALFELLYAAAETALKTVSPITASHFVPPGRYYKLKDGGEFLLVDLCFIRAGAPDHFLEVERHGHIRPLFDKRDWLHAKPLDEGALAIMRDKRYRELQTWFVVSQSFVRKAVMRRQQAEALACFWSYTLKPLTELIRMRYCPVRWDFGMRYLERDLPSTVYNQLRDLIFVRDLDELEVKLATASTWGASLLRELDMVAQIRTG